MTQTQLQLMNESSANGVNASLVVTGYDLSGTLLPSSSDKAHGLLLFGNVAYSSLDMNPEPKTLLTGQHPKDIGRASLTYPDVAKTVRRLPLPGNAVHASHHDTLSFNAL